MKQTYKLSMEYTRYISKYDDWFIQDPEDFYFTTDKIGVKSGTMLDVGDLSDEVFKLVISSVTGNEYLEGKIREQFLGEIRNLSFHFEPIEIIEV